MDAGPRELRARGQRRRSGAHAHDARWPARSRSGSKPSTTPARSFSYAIIGNSPLPLRDYLSTVKIRETGPDACEIAWEGRFEPNAGSEASMQRMVRGIYTNGIAALRKKLGV